MQIESVSCVENGLTRELTVHGDFSLQLVRENELSREAFAGRRDGRFNLEHESFTDEFLWSPGAACLTFVHIHARDEDGVLFDAMIDRSHEITIGFRGGIKDAVDVDHDCVEHGRICLLASQIMHDAQIGGTRGICRGQHQDP